MISIKIEGLKKTFGKNMVLKGIDLDISEPKIITILGPNASGKTTLIKSVLGMVIPDEGSVEFDGVNVKGKWDYKKERFTNSNYANRLLSRPFREPWQMPQI